METLELFPLRGARLLLRGHRVLPSWPVKNVCRLVHQCPGRRCITRMLACIQRWRAQCLRSLWRMGFQSGSVSKRCPLGSTLRQFHRARRQGWAQATSHWQRTNIVSYGAVHKMFIPSSECHARKMRKEKGGLGSNTHQRSVLLFSLSSPSSQHSSRGARAESILTLIRSALVAQFTLMSTPAVSCEGSSSWA